MIKVDQKKPYLKWLGIHFDRKLSFKQHVSIQTSKALQVANALRCFGNTMRGISPQLSKQVISACVLPIAYFGTPTWWPGKTRKKGYRIISNRVGTHLNMLDKMQRAAARAILPVYRTTPSATLYRESGLNPAELTLEYLSRRAIIRTRRLDPYHPLFIKCHRLASSPPVTRFSRMIRTIPPSEQIDPLSIPPWERFSARNRLSATTLDFSSPDRKASIFRDFLNSLPKGDILVFTDGSNLPDGRAGIGFVIFQLDRQISSGSSPLGKNNQMCNIEVHAALQGIHTALNLPTIRFACNLWLFIDNQKVVKSLSKYESVKSSSNIYDQIIEANNKWKSRGRLPHTLEGEIKVCWIPGHSGIEGNELADLEAKKGTVIPLRVDQPEHSLASLEKWLTTYTHDARKSWWNKDIPNNYIQLEIADAPTYPKELHLSRKALGRIISFRTGHGDFDPYYTRFGHTEANLRCQCGSFKTRLHLFYCRILRRRGHRPAGPINLLIPELLGTPEGAIVQTNWLEETKFFEQVCTR